MRQPQFPTMSLMIFVAICSVWVLAVSRPTEILTSLVFTTTIGMLGFAILMAAIRRDEQGAFWKGFAICGGLYFLVALAPLLKSGEAPYFLPEILLNDIYLYATTGDSYFIHQLSAPIPSPRPHFVKNAHALLTILLALGGGFIARITATRQPPR